jgi:predicted acyl esterase
VYDFLELFVARQAPIHNRGIVDVAAPTIYHSALGLPKGDEVTLPPDPVQEQSTYAGALAAFEALPEVRVLFDNGAGASPRGSTTPGNPYPAFEQSFSEFPIPGTTAGTWYLGPSGTLNEQPAAAEGVDSYTSDASATPLTDYSTNAGPGGLWGDAAQWEWNWVQPTATSAVSYVSAPLGADTTAIGGGAVNLWVKSSTPDVDLQATVSEVRPDSNETFVQNGWIRASERKLATTADNMFKQSPTPLEPIPTFLASDLQPVPADEFVPVTIPLYFQGHVYRAGSRIRVTISAPNGTQPVWSFSHTQPENTTANVSIGFGPAMPANVTLPIVPGVSVPTGLPPCPSLRNEPCRSYQAFVNNGS